MAQIIYLSQITDKALDFTISADAEQNIESLSVRLRRAISEAKVADGLLASAIKELVACLEALNHFIDRIDDPQMQKRLREQTEMARAALVESSCEVSLQVRMLSGRVGAG
jgi:hypothetical protein